MFFKHETSAYPFALSSNGNLRTTAKSALLPILESYGFSQSSAPTCDVYVIDGPVGTFTNVETKRKRYHI